MLEIIIVGIVVGGATLCVHFKYRRDVLCNKERLNHLLAMRKLDEGILSEEEPKKLNGATASGEIDSRDD